MNKKQFIYISETPKPEINSSTCDLFKKIVIKQKKPTAIFSLDKPDYQLALSLLFMNSSIDLYKFRTGRLHKKSWDKITETAKYFSTLPIFIGDSKNLSLKNIISKTKELVSQHNIELIVIDYLTFVKHNRNTKIIDFIKKLIDTINISVLIFSKHEIPKERKIKNDETIFTELEKLDNVIYLA